MEELTSKGDSENKKEEKRRRKVDFNIYFWIPSAINVLVTLCSGSIYGTGVFYSASIFIVLGIVLAFFKPRKGGFMILAGILAWLIGASICGLILTQVRIY